MDDVRLAESQGAVEICFLGQNVNGYGDPSGLAGLIRETARLGGVRRIRYTSPYPTEMTDDLISLHGTEPKLLPFLNLPAQSGSSRILGLMGREYSVDDYLAIVEKLRRARPDIRIGSDFIVGFPGETDDDFNMTCEIAKKVGHINSYSFKYSPRPHTAAASMPGQVPENIKRDRLKILDGIIGENTRAFNESCVGKVFPCVLESSDKNGNMVMRTPFMQQVVAPAAETRPDFADVRITDGNKCSLRGEICG
jgi:tRNA-2-methylthio-N6-dimethylallyladenosine synthase